jgi:hypothetical protein
MRVRAALDKAGQEARQLVGPVVLELEVAAEAAQEKERAIQVVVRPAPAEAAAKLGLVATVAKGKAAEGVRAARRSTTSISRSTPAAD